MSHQVVVTYNGEGVPLGINSPSIELIDGDTVEWIFQNVPSGDQVQVYIHFHVPSNQPFGPFQGLKPSGHSVIGVGNSGVPGMYSYTALVLNQDGPLATSEEVAVIGNLSDKVDTVSVALGLIVYTPGDPPAVVVTPPILRIHGVHTVVWLIEGLPDEYFVNFHFGDFFLDSMNGPFSSFVLSRSYGNTRLAVGTGFGSGSRTQGAPLDSIPYFVSVRNSLGTMTASDDPTIEPLGTPPNP